MADETSPKSEPEIVEPAPAAAPPRRGPRHDPGVIEGEATEIREAPPPEAPSAEAAAEPPPTEAPGAAPAAAASEPEIRRVARRAGLPLLAGALGAVVGAALTLGAAWLVDPRAAALDAADSRLAALERAGEAQAAANADFERRLAAVETSHAAAAKAEAGKGEPAQSALAEARAARADAAKALALAAGTGAAAPAPAEGGAPASSDAGALETRLGAVESQLTGLKSGEADFGALGERLAKVESALAAPKSEARVAADEATAGDRGGAAEAILAISLNARLDAGEPFAAELAALARLGADGAKLAALKPYADAGAPTAGALAASFAKVAPSLVAAATPPSGGVIDRLLDHMRKLVRVRKVGESAGDDADALAARMSAALARHDLSAALEAYQALPEAARQAGRDWAQAAKARQGAAEAAEGLRADAVGRLAAAKN